MTDIRFHHIGYAVTDIEEYLERFVCPLLNPISVSDPVIDEVQRVRVCFVALPGGTTIELVEPFGDASPIANIVGSRRGGLYHLCYEVSDIATQLARFRNKRCLPLSAPVPATAFGGRRIVFLMTPEHDLIELLEGCPDPNSRSE